MRNHAYMSTVLYHPRKAGKTAVRMALGNAAEMVALRLAETFGRDTVRNPVTRDAHVAYVNGAIGMALSLGLLPEERAMQLRNACGQMMTGAALPASDSPAIDPGYARIIVAVRRNAGASLSKPAELVELGTVGARAMLVRLQADGIIAEADMFGFHPLRAAEV